MHIRIQKQTAEECIIVFLDILSADIADHIIYAYIYHEVFAYFVDEVEIIVEVLENEAAPIKEVRVESEEEEKWKKLRIVWKEATRIFI